MANDENKFLPIFQILDIKNVSFLLKLEMALATTITMKFEPVSREQQSQVYEAAFARTIGQKSDFCIIGSFFLFTHNIEIQRLNQNSTTIK